MSAHSELRPANPKPFGFLIFLSAATVALSIFLLAAMLILAAQRSDDLSRARFHQVVSYALDRSLEKVPYDQESVAIWDDAVKNVTMDYDAKWIDSNLGVWLHDYFKHDRVYVLDATGAVIYEMADGKQQLPPTGTRLHGTLLRFVKELRQSVKTGAMERYTSGQERVPRVADFGDVDGRPAIVSVMPIVSDTGALTQPLGTESLLISVRFIDQSFLSDLGQALLLNSVRFSKLNHSSPAEQTFTITSKNGANLGQIIWQVKLSGSAILTSLAPLFVLGTFAIGFAVTFLIRRLRATYAELAASEAQSWHMAYHDALSGLSNRAHFNERLDHALETLRVDGTGFGLLILDLDRFKEVNDTYGHAAGDAVIREVAQQLQALVGPDDVLARLGGDEFALITPTASTNEIEVLARAAISKITVPISIDGATASVGISIGVALALDKDLDRPELIRRADTALYEAKKSATEQLKFYSDEMGEKIRSRRLIEAELRKALATGQGLEVVYQPILSAETLRITGAEALPKWDHPRLGAISPTVFVALAEECGLIRELGAWVLRRACGAAQAWNLETISINVSALQCQAPGFADEVLATLRNSGFPANRLEIEIAESVLFDGSATSSRTLSKLRMSGIKLALADFGTGHSSLNYLIKLEVDRIKIDQSFIQNLAEARPRAIVQAIMAMAKAVNVAVTAEGVETHTQLTFLALHGCDRLQGALFSQSVVAAELTRLLAQNEPKLVFDQSVA